MNPVLFEVWREKALESTHRGRYAVVADGRLLASEGDVRGLTFMRSSAKPFQAMTVVRSGAMDAYGLADDELAVICGSHYGEDVHVRAVQSILRKAGLKAAQLQCGAHAPVAAAAQKALFRARREPTSLHNNCSGKHAGMLAAARRMKAPLASYLDERHPVQKANLATVAEYARVPAARIRVARDGCSAPTFGLPLQSIARAFAALADPFGEDADFRVPLAMMSHPHMVGHPCEELMKALPREIVGKVGAEGVYGAAVMGHSIGIAVKIDDGSFRPLLPVVAALLKRLGLFNGAKEAALDALAKPEIINHAGRLVGHTRVRLG